MNDSNKETAWLERPETIKRLWWGFGIVLAATVIAQLFIKVKPEFGIDGWFGFGALYGFLCCLVMVVFAKLLGFILKRDQDYYDHGEEEEGSS